MLRGIGVDYLRVDDLYSSLFTTVTEKNYDTVNKQRRKRIFIGFFIRQGSFIIIITIRKFI